VEGVHLVRRHGEHRAVRDAEVCHRSIVVRRCVGVYDVSFVEGRRTYRSIVIQGGRRLASVPKVEDERPGNGLPHEPQRPPAPPGWSASVEPGPAPPEESVDEVLARWLAPPAAPGAPAPIAEAPTRAAPSAETDQSSPAWNPPPPAWRPPPGPPSTGPPPGPAPSPTYPYSQQAPPAASAGPQFQGGGWDQPPPWSAPPQGWDQPPQGRWPPAPYYGTAQPTGSYMSISTPAKQRRGLLITIATLAVVEAVVITVLSVALSHHSSSTGNEAIGSSTTTLSGNSSTTSLPVGTSITATAGSVFFDSRFAPSDYWVTGQVTPHTTGRLTKSGYQLTGTGDIQHGERAPSGLKYPAISVSVTAGSLPLSDVSLGPQCVAGSGSYPAIYQFAVRPIGVWFLERRNPGTKQGISILQSGQSPQVSAPVTVELACITQSISSGIATNALIAFIQGQQVLNTTDRWNNMPTGGWQAGLMIGTYGTTESVTFTHFVCRRLPTS
jgi:hypothetical protein